MENYFLKKPIDNKSSLSPEESIILIKKLFKSYLPIFELKTEYNSGNYYGFGLKYSYKNIEIMFGGERDSFSHSIFIENKQYSLLHFDIKMNKVNNMSINNYKYAFYVLVKFLKNYL